MVNEKINFINRAGHNISARLDIPEGNIKTYAIFAHCFTCSKDILAASRISRELIQDGIAVLRFDFTGLGNSEGDFSNTNFTSNCSDLIDAYNYMVERNMKPHVLIGHSLGGAAVLASSGHMPEVRAIFTIGAPSDVGHLEHLLTSSLEDIESHGEGRVKLAGREFLIKKQFLDDIRSVSLEDKVRNLNASLMIFHSPIDEVVSIDHAKKIYLMAKHPKSFVALDGASHLLDSKEDSEYVANIISSWCHRYI